MRRPLFSRTERAWLLGGLRAVSAAAFTVLGAALIVAMLSYEPSDPGYFSATWRKPQNLLGAHGALVADLLHRSVGLAGYALGALALVWALRILLRAWPDKILRRLLSTPLALLCFAALLSGEPDMAQSGGGLGGLLGDTIFSMMNSGLPLESPKIRYIATVVILALLTPPLALAALGGNSFGALSWLQGGFVELGRVAASAAGAARDLWLRSGGGRFGAGLLASLAALFEGWSLSRPAMAGAAGGSGFGSESNDPGFSFRRNWPGDGPTAGGGSGGAAPRRRRSVPKAPPAAEPGFTTARRHREEPGFSAGPSEDLAQAPTNASDATITPPPSDGAPLSDAVQPPSWAIEAAASGDALSARVREAEAAQAQTALSGTDAAPFGDDQDRVPFPGDVDAATSTSIETGSTPELQSEPAPDAASLAAATPELEPRSAPEPEPEPAQDQNSPEGPSLDLLANPEEEGRPVIDERDLAERADKLQSVLQDYGVRGDIIHVSPGPVVSLFELEPAPGLKAARVVGLADDIARSMSAAACRVSPVPGKNLIGIELPNENRETVLLSELLASDAYQEGDWTLPLALGKDIAGEPVIADLARMPHLLIAGTTGSGKSVAINTMLLSLLYRLDPSEARLILIDPKMLELSVYNGAPHLLAPVVTDPKQAVAALRWVVREMENRYQRMAKLNVRSLESYNAKIAEADGDALTREVQVGFCDETSQPIFETQATPAEPMARIVVVIDEMADLMLVAGKEIERLVQRLAQMARAAGIHLVMATQRPSVDVITGVIKANFPIRVSFQVTSKIDSRTILNEPGAEQLLGKGDMLFTTGSGKLQRLHGPFVSDAEVEAVAMRLRAMGPVDEPVDFDARPETSADTDENAGVADDSDDALYEKAVAIVQAEQKASTSFLQRRLQIGYNRAARLVDRLEEKGVISPANHSGKRDVLIGPASEP